MASGILCMLLGGCDELERPAGEIRGARIARDTIGRREAARRKPRDASAAAESKQILFGDLHVHTTYSIDAFMYSLPLFSGEGAHPPADACDFARHCSGLDFFSINDHAEGLTPDLWERTKQSIRQCNDVAGDGDDPDMVAFMGFEWTQTGPVPENHYGHKNVIFPGLADDELPARPITSLAVSGQSRPPRLVMDAAAGVAKLTGFDPYADLIAFMAELSDIPDCDPDTPTRDLPRGCRENAETPAELFRRLEDWGFPTLVIPHGLAWGVHAPPGATLGAQLSREQHDPDMQRLIEISSGHGNSEEFRDYPEHVVDASGEAICPEPTRDYLPCCWRAGEIMRERCGDLPANECEARVEEARQLALEAGVSPHHVFPDTDAEDWLDCDQCRDCFKPAMSLRPGMTAQYGAAISNFEDGEGDTPLRFRWGFISSTDNHAARPGTGYKQYQRRIMTDARGMASETTRSRVMGWFVGEQEDPQRAQPAVASRLGELFDTEREASFMYPGGLVAVHATGRDRHSIWEALMRREVYGTSGPRILLWFDLLNGPAGPVPMGGEVELDVAPRFRVQAAGAFIQQPGCPEESLAALSPERLHALCRDECYYPSYTRHIIDAIEVIRIRPQARPGEDVASLIEDPWRRFECAPDPAGCRIEFDDPEYATLGRDTVYYVRALQAPTPAINAANLRAEFDAAGNVTRVDPCYGGYRTPADDDCLAPVRERAWSSPIYVDRVR